MKTFVQSGDKITMLAPADVLSGAGVLVGALFGVAHGDALSGAAVVLQTTGVVTLNKAAGTINPGVRLFWDDSAKRVTTTVTSAFPVGYHVGTAANSAAAGEPITVLLRPSAPTGA